MSQTPSNLLIELGTEELPPASLKKLSEAFSQNILKGLVDAGLTSQHKPQIFATPRRLGVLIKDVSHKQSDREIERVGPPVKAATDGDGNPTKVGLGFARSVGVDFAELGTKETGRGPCLHFKSMQKGLPLHEVLATVMQTALDKLPIGKRMRWGDRKEQFVRPVRWLLALSGEDIVPIEVMGLKSDRLTNGHRFHTEGPLKVESADGYEALLLEKGYVIADFSQRRQKVQAEVSKAASTHGRPELDPSLIDEVTGLVEWPVGLLGRFQEEFLKVPQECLISSMKSHQKYFPVLDDKGVLLPYFVLVSNVESSNPQAIIEGNEKVITPRLQDAAFFFDGDIKRGLAFFQEQLKTVTYQAELGTVHEKTERIAQLAAHLAKLLDTPEADCRQAGELCKADLASDMVFEFTELQGTMGQYYAKAEGLKPEIALALHEHYMPRYSGDTIPSSGVGAAVSLADKADTITGMFGIGKPPTGSKDPYSLRRAAIGLLRIAIEKEMDLDLGELFQMAQSLYSCPLKNTKVVEEATAFVMGRFPAKYKEEGKRQDAVAAVQNLGIASPYDFHLRVEAVEAFLAMPEAESLTQANKRVLNILKDQNIAELAASKHDDSVASAPAELSLAEALAKKEKAIIPHMEARDYTNALKSLADLRPVVDTFFNDVKVMDDDAKVKQNRLILLGRLRKLFLGIADISQFQ